MSANLALAPASSAPERTDREPLACAHCGLPALGAAEAGTPAKAFCCPACETAYLIIQDAGLGAYYAERVRSETARARARASERSYAEYDEPSFVE